MSQYVFVKSKERMKFSFSRFKKAAMFRLFNNPFQFVWNMVTYHALILFCVFILGFNPPVKVALGMGSDPIGGIESGTQTYLSMLSWDTAIFFAVILILDFWLLAIIKDEIKPKFYEMDVYGQPKKEWLTYKRIVMLEGVILVLGIFNPYIRAGMLFFGANTIQVAIVKKWMIVKWRPERLQFGEPAKYFFILGSYLLILDLLRRMFVWGVWG